MRSIRLSGPTDFSGWRQASRQLIRDAVPPEAVTWNVSGGQSSLLGDVADCSSADAAAVGSPAALQTFNVSREFIELAQSVSLHRDPARFSLLYRLLWRLQDQSRLLAMTMDPDIVKAAAMAKSVGRDIHKMHAFVRFRAPPQTDSSSDVRPFIAWFEPEHHIVAAATPFFARRFPNFAWAILTPECSAYWNMSTLTFGPGAHRSDAPADDAAEDLWRQYYASIFNPARLKIDSMRAHMPKKYWRNLPESELIPQLIADAQERTRDMIARTPTESKRAVRRPAAPAAVVEYHDKSLRAVRAEAEHCRACPLWKNATQTVFGLGGESAKIMFVGEQPGDQEDLAGKPFVGPAGKLLDRALQDAGIDRSATYVTNAVKHFKFEPRGKRRIHKKPNEMEISACHQWLDRELHLVEPQLIVALGATAARAVFGRATAIEKNRGRVIPSGEDHERAADVLVTVHPSYLLRIPSEDRELAYERFVDDLKLVRKYA